MTVQVILIPPSGMSVTSSEFVTSGAGQYTTTYQLEPGNGRDIEVRIKTNQVGDFKVKGRIIYYYGDNKSTAEDYTLTLPIKVMPNEPSTENAPATQKEQTPASPNIGTPALLLIFMILYKLVKNGSNR